MRSARIVPALLLLALLMGLSLSVAQAQGADLEINKALFARYSEEFYNQRNLDLGAEIFADDVILHQPGAPDSVGLEAFKQSYQALINDWPDGKVTAGATVADGEYVAATYFWEATFSRPIAGPAGEIKPTGKKVQFNGTMLVHFKDGKIAEEWKMWDAWNVYQQMGVIPAQGELPVVTPWSAQLGASTLSPKESRDLVAAGFQIWPKIIPVGGLAMDYTVHTPLSLGPQPEPGFAGAALWTKQYLTMFPDFTLTGPGGQADYVMAAEGDLVFILYSGQFHFTQDIPGMKANGALVASPGLSVLRLKDGQLAEFWINVDTASMMMQMAAPPA